MLHSKSITLFGSALSKKNTNDKTYNDSFTKGYDTAPNVLHAKITTIPPPTAKTRNLCTF
jgi:hypothetical protein